MKTSDDAFDADIDLDEEETLEEEGLEGEELTRRKRSRKRGSKGKS